MAGFGWALSNLSFFERFEAPSSPVTKSGNHAKPNLLANIVSISEDVCYIWWTFKHSLVRVLCSDIWMNDDDIKFQEWPLSDELNFQVTRLSCRKGNHIPQEALLAWGPSGLAIIKYELISGRGSIKCTIVAEKAYIEHPKLKILQVKWAPTSKYDVVAVLNNDNYLRLYNINDPQEVVSLVCVGPSESVPFSYTRHSVGLVEPPVDFEFGQRLDKSGLKTVYVLKSSGTVSYFLLLAVESTGKYIWEKEFTIFADGELEDVFEDASTLLVSKSFPPIISIGCLNGNLYHTVLLPSESDAAESATLNMEQSLMSGDVTLFVKEILELEPDNEGGFVSLRFVPDPLCSHRYACIHDEGVHLINQHFVINIMKYLDLTEADRADLLSPRSCRPSTVRYVLCAKPDEENKLPPLNGTNAAFSESFPQRFILFLANGETLVYDIPHALNNFQLSGERNEQSQNTLSSNTSTITEGGGDAQEDVGLSILEAVKKLLNKNANQPYIMAGSAQELPTEKNEELLMHGLRVLKWEYIQRQEQVIDFLLESLKVLEVKVTEMKEPVQQLAADQSELRNSAEAIAELYEEGLEREEAIQKRLDAILFKHHQSFPMITDDEKTWLRTMVALQTEVNSMSQTVDGLKRNCSKAAALSPTSMSTRSRERQEIFSSAQIAQIRNQVEEHGRILAKLAHSIKEFQKDLNLPEV